MATWPAQAEPPGLWDVQILRYRTNGFSPTFEEFRGLQHLQKLTIHFEIAGGRCGACLA